MVENLKPTEKPEPFRMGDFGETGMMSASPLSPAEVQFPAAWQPIETVRRDTHWVLLFDPVVGGGCVVGRFSGGHWWSHDDWVLRPTHWMPLPARPADVSVMPRHEFGER